MPRPYNSEVAALEALWLDISSAGQACLDCEKPLQETDVIARTVATKEAPSHAEGQLVAGTGQNEALHFQTLATCFYVRHRHLNCLLTGSTRYVAISHVWNPEIATSTVPPGLGGSGLAEETARKVFRVTKRICDALRSEYFDTEIWFDYISVPQWHKQAKARIIEHISDIFSSAEFVVVHLKDVDHSHVHAMRHGANTEEIVCGISRICNSKYFGRVWTAMEYTQSNRIRILLKGFTWVAPDDDKPRLVPEMQKRWRDEVAKHEHPHQVEFLANMGYNLVPWMLGPLSEIRGRKQSGAPVEFASAYVLLSKRNATFPIDFFYALINTLGLKALFKHVDEDGDHQEVLLQIMRYCLQKGDLSPLLMIPSSAQRTRKDSATQAYGYTDLVTWGLTKQVEPPTFAQIRFESDFVILRAEELGQVKTIRRMSWWGDRSSFRMSLKLALESTGPHDLDAFINALGARLFGLAPQAIHEYLAQRQRREQLRQSIRTVYDLYPHYNRRLEHWIADSMGISNQDIKQGMTPIANVSSHAGSIHLGSAAAFIYVKCNHCKETYIIWAALLKPASELLNVTAYRIPGLRYRCMENAGGAGFLVKEGHVVGRFIWATPTCDCEKHTEMAVRLEAPPLPRPNTYHYGSQNVKKGECVTISQDDHVRYAPRPIN